MTLSELAEQYRAARDRAAALKRQHDDAKLEADKLQREMFARMETENVGHIKVGKHAFTRAQTIYGSVQDRGAFLEWAESEAPELIESRERKALVNALVREALDNGSPLPPGLGFYADERVSLRVA